MAITSLITADELLEMDLEPGRYDLIDGDLYQMAPAGDGHGETTINITIPVGVHVRANDLGSVFAAETGFVIGEDPDIVVAPDLAFVRKGRLAPDRDKRRFARIVPDFAVEVVSPSDYPKLIQLKIDTYLIVNIPMLVVVSPERQMIRVYRHGFEPVELGVGDVLDGGDVLPGFRLPVADIFR